MIYGEAVTIGGGGQTASILATGALTSADSCYATKGGKTYNGVWKTVQTPNPEWRGLPSGYTQVEYIRSSGTQYILLNKVLDIDDLTITSAITMTSQQHNELFSTSDNDNHYSRLYYTYNAAGWGAVIFNGYGGSGTGTVVYDTKTTYRFYDNKFYVNGNELYSLTYSSTSVQNNNFSIFGWSNGTRLTTASIYSLIASKNSNTICDLVPCLNTSTGEYGLYDLVSNTFFGNAGTGTFTAGEAVPQYFTTQGFLIDKLKEYGTYTVTATQGTQSKTVDVMVDSAERFDISITFVPAGALYWLGDECTSITGGWSARNWKPASWFGNGTATLTKYSDYMLLSEVHSSSSHNGVAEIANNIDFTNYTTMYVEYGGTMTNQYCAISMFIVDRTVTYMDNGTKLRWADLSGSTSYARNTYSADVSSITGSYDVCVNCMDGGYGGDITVTVYKIWLE